MGPEFFGCGGWWVFPMSMPIVMILVLVVVLYLVFGHFGGRPPQGPPESERSSRPQQQSETAVDILMKRYARGELTREEFEQMQQDLER